MYKKILALVMALAVMFAFTGCMSSNNEVTVKADGTADVYVDFSIDKTKMESVTYDVMLEMAKAAADENAAEADIIKTAQDNTKDFMEGFEEATKNIFKFDGSCLEVTKRGAVNVHMLFEEQKKNMTTYHTPFGDILIGIDTEKIEVSEEENKIHVHVDYSLEANYQHLANCKIDMKIYPKKEGAKLFT